MGRILIAGLVGGVIIFVWSAVSWMFLGWHNTSGGKLTNEEAVDAWRITVKDGAVVYALSAVKNVGEAAMALIVDAREAGGAFVDLIDFAEIARVMVGDFLLEALG